MNLPFWKRIFPFKFWRRPKPQKAVVHEESRDYRVFTRQFDRVVAAKELKQMVGRDYEAERDKAWTLFRHALAGWKTRCQLTALELSGAIQSALSVKSRKDTVVSVLIDHSGSMRGQPMLMTAATIEILGEFLTHLGCTVEVLGFTTQSWQGGRARKLWKKQGRPRRPGRLCDLLHIVYKSANERFNLDTYKPMLMPDLLKENVDGEALEWAAERLRTLPHSRKILLVISDGAPVDDSTLFENETEILDRHLRKVIATLEEATDLELAAMGIGYEVSRYYRTHGLVTSPEDLGISALYLISDMLMDKTKPTLH